MIFWDSSNSASSSGSRSSSSKATWVAGVEGVVSLSKGCASMGPRGFGVVFLPVSLLAWGCWVVWLFGPSVHLLALVCMFVCVVGPLGLLPFLPLTRLWSRLLLVLGDGGTPSPDVSFGAAVSLPGGQALLHACGIDLLRHFPMGVMSRMAPDQPLVPEHEGGIAAV